MAGKDWYYGFMRRHPNLSLRTPEQISMARAKAFSKENVDQFFTNLRTVLEETTFARDRIWNMDETGFPTVPTKVQKTLAEKGAKRVGQMASAERGTNVTAAVAINAAGTFIPPFFLFPTKHMQGRFMDGASSECVGYANGSGWMQQPEFIKFMEHFIRHAHARKDSPTLLLLDNHTSHMSIKALDLAVEHGITIVSFPPHCSHRMQPLDCGVFAPIKARYVSKHASWMKNNAGNVFALHHVAPIVEQCLDEAATPDVIKKAFERTGIYKFNPHVFTENDFFAADLVNNVQRKSQGNQREDLEDERVVVVLDQYIPTASVAEVSSSFAEISSIMSTLNAVGPVQPGEVTKKSNRGRKPMKSSILTSTEKRDELQKQAKKRHH